MVHSCIVDGNAYFFTATDVVRRMQFSFGKKAIILGVGYPITDAVFAPHRRAADLTPSATTEYPGNFTTRAGQPQSRTTHGEASDFHNILETCILPLVESELLPAVPLRRLPKALFGHSFGGLFTLYSLFTKPGLFDTYIAASPSIWWNDCSIVKEQGKQFLDAPAKPGSGSKPSLYLMYGSNEQAVARKPYESDEEYERRQRNASQRRMKSNALELADRIGTSDKLADVWLQEFEAEDHGSAAICALQRGLIRLLGE